ncbi:methyl-accepting chemotaxis protein [Xanthomonas sp. MUS 060]|uniref:HAMP domain-containing protein n=1 Tax=Xanthomonas sp. MUS 060 TaxID=1588031 RepID=UPI0013923B4E|nr:methyl-accepting chemotaxis protein [Xanthomonas sp. MUS 060]
MLIAGGVAVLVISSLLAWAITRSLTEPLNRATRAAEAIANGRLDNHVATDARDEPGRSGDGQWSQHAHCRWRGGTGHQQSAGLGDHPQPH